MIKPHINNTDQTSTSADHNARRSVHASKMCSKNDQQYLSFHVDVSKTFRSLDDGEKMWPPVGERWTIWRPIEKFLRTGNFFLENGMQTKQTKHIIFKKLWCWDAKQLTPHLLFSSETRLWHARVKTNLTKKFVQDILQAIPHFRKIGNLQQSSNWILQRKIWHERKEFYLQCFMSETPTRWMSHFQCKTKKNIQQLMGNQSNHRSVKHSVFDNWAKYNQNWNCIRHSELRVKLVKTKNSLSITCQFSFPNPWISDKWYQTPTKLPDNFTMQSQILLRVIAKNLQVNMVWYCQKLSSSQLPWLAIMDTKIPSFKQQNCFYLQTLMKLWCARK